MCRLLCALCLFSQKSEVLTSSPSCERWLSDHSSSVVSALFSLLALMTPHKGIADPPRDACTRGGERETECARERDRDPFSEGIEGFAKWTMMWMKEMSTRRETALVES